MPPSSATTSPCPKPRADLYASRWVTLREIVLPVVQPGIIAGCILVFVPSLGAFLAPDLLGGAKNFMIGSLIEEQFKGSQGNWPFGAAAAMILMTLVLIVLMVFARQQSQAEEAHDERCPPLSRLSAPSRCSAWSSSTRRLIVVTVYSFNDSTSITALGRVFVALVCRCLHRPGSRHVRPRPRGIR